MPDPNVISAIEQSQNLTVQSKNESPLGVTVFPVLWMARAGMNIAPWWSVTRDVQLRQFWKGSDHLAGAMYSMQAKMTAIPVRIEARDMSIKQHVKEAMDDTEILYAAPGYGKGWIGVMETAFEDLFSQDNGMFLEVIGRGPKDGPILGKPISISHLDAGRCQRTGDPTYPVIYMDDDGTRYKLHYTRVIEMSSQTTPIKEMCGIGFCAVSRCSNVSQTLIDLLVFKQEKMGSRPLRQILITKGGLDPSDISAAFKVAESTMDSQGLTRYSKVVVGGSMTLPEADIKTIDMSTLPDGFNEEMSITLGMATIALAFGTDARELFPAMSAGATRADALLQHLKQRGKAPGQILQTLENQFNFKYCPPYLKFVTDFQDDAQDRQTAEIKMLRANIRVQNQASNSVDKRIAHEQMWMDGDLDQSQFERLELDDGRLSDGTPSLALFQKKSREYSQYLEMGVENPLDVKANNPEVMLEKIADKRLAVYDTLANATDEIERWTALEAQSALAQLELLYIPSMQQIVESQNATSTGNVANGENKNTKPPANKGNLKGVPGGVEIDPRLRKVDLTSPSHAEQSYGQALGQAGGSE